jgi:importin subunit beta-1
LKNSFGNLDKECELQGLLCGVLQTLTQRLKGKITPGAPALMQEYLKVFEAYRQVKGGAPVIHEEALLAVAALANSIEAAFEPFMPHFMPFLHLGLQGIEDTQVCLMSVGVVTDLCRALQIKILPYVEQFVQILYTNLQNPKVDRKIKAAIMTTFGDIALAVTGEFEKFLGPVIGMLSEASQTKLEDGNPDNEDWIDYLNQLREGVLVAYAGIIHGLRESGKIVLFKEHVNSVLDFVRRVVDDSSVSEDVMKQAVCVVGDLIMVFQQELTTYLSQAPFLPKLVKWSSESSDPDIRKTAQWLMNLLSQYRPQ